MATQASNTQNKSPILPENVRRFFKNSFWRLTGIALFMLSLVVVVALASFHPDDPTANQATDAPAQNLLGIYGSYPADILLQTLGLGSVAIILALLTWGYRLVTLKTLPWIWGNLIALPFFTTFLCAFFASFIPPEGWPTSSGLGGFLGFGLYRLVDEGVFSLIQYYLPAYAWGGLFFILTAAMAPFTLGLDKAEWLTMRNHIQHWFAMLWHYIVVASYAIATAIYNAAQRLKGKPESVRASKTPANKPTPRLKEVVVEEKPETTTSKKRVSSRKAPKKGKRAADEQQTTFEFASKDGFQLPQLSLLKAEKASNIIRQSDDALEQNARLLESVLEDFSIKGTIENVRPGPVVTLYELEPAPGLKASRVIGLADDIARSMSALSARVAVIPGKNLIGIELPNTDREIVYLRELLASNEFEKHQGRLPMILGKDIGGGPIIADLATMPHLLVAGTTGSGKSVGINTMILSLLYRFAPDECKFIMIDPKMLELSVYDDIPHLLTPVVTEPKKAVVALKWAVREMEERYRAMSKIGVRNHTAFNEMVSEAQKKGEPITRRVQTGFDKETGNPVYEMQEFDFMPLPLIVIIIDEMADLMQTAGKEVEAAVQRLAQMARAAGLHMIMATQRPSVDVITGTIKANFPTRISFQVTSKIDSRTILGEQGAEQLLGKGDMLFMAGGGQTTRVHGPFVSDQEVEDVVAFLKKQGAPEYKSEITEEPEEGYEVLGAPSSGGGGSDDGSGDENSLFDQAVAIVVNDGKASTSYIQRRLRIGYNRAADLIERMESEGIISAANHAGKREILARRPDEFED